MNAAFAFGIRYYPFDYCRWVNAPFLVFDIGADQGQSTLIPLFLARNMGSVVACASVPGIFVRLETILALIGFNGAWACPIVATN
jgi:hypothetical protein